MTLIFDDYANSCYYFNGHYCHQKRMQFGVKYTGAGFPEKVTWSVWEAFSFRVPQFLCLLTSDCCDSETPVLRLEILFSPDKKALYKDDRSPLSTIFLPYSLNRGRAAATPEQLQMHHQGSDELDMYYMKTLQVSVCKNWSGVFIVFVFQSHFISALTVVFVNSKSLSSLKIDDTPVDDPSLKVLVANNSDTLRLLKMSSCPHVSPAGAVLFCQIF